MTRLWHPFAAMGKVDGHEFVLVRGEGARVWDADGAEYLDATAGLWFAQRRPRPGRDRRRGRSPAAHARRAPHLRRPREPSRPSSSPSASPRWLRFRTRPSSSPPAAPRRSTRPRKIVRRYWALLGQPERTVIVSRRHAYHGTAAYGTSLSGIPAIRDGYGTFVGRRGRGRPRRSRRPRADARRARRPCRRVHRRADDRRGRRDPAARGLLAGGRAHLPRARRAPDRRRGDLGLRAARQRGSAASATASRPT